jgi:hypothetical protein
LNKAGDKSTTGTRANDEMEDTGVEKFGILKLVKSSTAASKYSGVRPSAKNKQGEHKWQAYLTVNGRKRALKGLYESPRDAAIQLAIKKQALKINPEEAWSEDEAEASAKPRAPRGARLVCMPLHVDVHAPTPYARAHSTLWLDLSLAGSNIKGGAAPLSALPTHMLARPQRSRALPAAPTPLASPAAPASLCMATPPVLAAPICVAQAVPLLQGDAQIDPACIMPGWPTCESFAWDPTAFCGRALRSI